MCACLSRVAVGACASVFVHVQDCERVHVCAAVAGWSGEACSHQAILGPRCAALPLPFRPALFLGLPALTPLLWSGLLVALGEYRQDWGRKTGITAVRPRWGGALLGGCYGCRRGAGAAAGQVGPRGHGGKAWLRLPGRLPLCPQRPVRPAEPGWRVPTAPPSAAVSLRTEAAASAPSWGLRPTCKNLDRKSRRPPTPQVSR